MKKFIWRKVQDLGLAYDYHYRENEELRLHFRICASFDENQFCAKCERLGHDTHSCIPFATGDHRMDGLGLGHWMRYRM